MQTQSESQSYTWFDELPVAQAPVAPSPNMFSIQRARPSNAIVVVPVPPPRDRGVSIWVLAFSAIAGASTFVLGVTLISLL